MEIVEKIFDAIFGKPEPIKEEPNAYKIGDILALQTSWKDNVKPGDTFVIDNKYVIKVKRVWVPDAPRITGEERRAFIKKDGGKCRICGSTKRLEVHHKDGNHSHNAEYNLTTLCKECHKKVTADQARNGHFNTYYTY